MSQILKGVEPEIICALRGLEFLEELLKIDGLTRGLAEKILKVFENSYELSKASIKSLTNIEEISIHNAIAIHKYFRSE